MSQSADDALGKAFGEKVKKKREALGLSQERLASQAGTTRETIRSIEGGHIPKVALIYKLARALTMHLWELLPADERDPDGTRGSWVARDSNPEPTDSQSVATPRLSVAAASKEGANRSTRVRRRSTKTSSMPIRRGKKAS